MSGHLVRAELERWLDAGELDLAMPGEGRTPGRWRALVELARRHDVSHARLAEAHVDAVAILHEAGRSPVVDAIYGVWASDATGHELVVGDGRVSGRKRFCSGLGIVDRALVTAIDGDGSQLLLDLDVRAGRGVEHDLSAWSTPALAGTRTGGVVFDDQPADGAVVHPEHHWYLDRPGFWHGACGPAACWAGAATGLVDVARAHVGDDPHALAHLGAMEASAWAMQSLLDRAGEEIDQQADRESEETTRERDTARARALAVRHLVERHCVEIVERFGRALGPRPSAHDGDVVQRIADVQLYVRQHHAERDLQALGALSAAGHQTANPAAP